MKSLYSLTLLVLSLSLSFIVQAQTAGKVIFTSGINKVIDSNGIERIAKRGEAVNSGDRIQTGSGRMQVRFSDNGFVSVKPRSELLIESYQFNGQQDGSENAIFNLLKGSVRAITGLIGNRNKQAYQYKTPVATIGIRGTAFVINYCNSDCFDDAGNPIADGLYVNNGEGKVILTSNGGSIDLIRGQFAYVEDEDSAPTQLREAPSISEQIDFVLDEIDEQDTEDLKEDQINNNLVNLDNSRFRSGFAMSHTGSSFASVSLNIGLYGTDYNERLRPLHNNSAFESIDGNTVVVLEQNALGQSRMRGYGQVYSYRENGADRTYLERFETTRNATGRFGSEDDYGVIWGTWETGWSNEVQDIDEGNSSQTFSVSANAQDDYLFHYILSNELTPIAENGRYQVADTVLQYGSKTEFVEGGQVAYFNTGMNSGEDAIYGRQRVFAEIDFSNGNINDFSMEGFFAGSSANNPSYTAQLDTTFQQSIYDQSDFLLRASCAASLCGSALETSNLLGNAFATIDFLGQNADAAMGSFGLLFGGLDGGPDHVIGGTYLIEQTGEVDSTIPQPTGIEGVVGMGKGGSSIVEFRGFSANNDTNSSALSTLTGFTENTNSTGLTNITYTEPSDSGFDDTYDVTIAIAQPDAALSGSNSALSVQWGAWQGEYTYTFGSGSNEALASPSTMHYIYSDNVTENANLPSTIVTFGDVLHGSALYEGGQGTQTGSLTGSMTVDFAAGNVTGFDLTTTIDSFTDTITLDSLSSNFVSDRQISISSSTCNICGITSGVSGNAFFEFVGANAEGVMGTFGVTDFSFESISGTFLFGQSSSIAPQ